MIEKLKKWGRRDKSLQKNFKFSLSTEFNLTRSRLCLVTCFPDPYPRTDMESRIIVTFQWENLANTPSSSDKVNYHL